MTKGERIKHLREQLHMTQEELAKKLSTTKQTISKYEKNIVTNIPSDRIEDMAVVLNSTPEYILGWEKDIEEKPVEMAERHFEMLMDEDLAEIFDEFKSLDASQKKLVKDLVHNLAKKTEA